MISISYGPTLSLTSLAYLRRRGDSQIAMIVMYHIVHQLINIPSSALFIPSFYTIYSTRGHDLKLLKPFSKYRSRVWLSSWQNISRFF